MLPEYLILEPAGLVFSENGECIANAMASHSGEKHQIQNLEFIELMPESDRHKEFSRNVTQEKCQHLKQKKEKTILELQKKIIENEKYIKLLEERIDERKTSLCTICIEEERNLIYFPCMHIVACTKCDQHQMIKKCPICRTKITNKQKAIIS